MPKIPLVSPGSVRGFMSARVPSALPKGYVSLLNDVRLEDGSVKVRSGAVSINAAVNAAQTYRGSFECTQNGVRSIFVATSNGSRISVLRSTDEGATFTAITNSSNDLADVGPVYFALAGYRSVDYLVIQNGQDDPRAYDGTAVYVLSDLSSADLTGSVQAGFLTSMQWTGTPAVANNNPDDLKGEYKPGYLNGTYLLVTGQNLIENTTTSIVLSNLVSSTGAAWTIPADADERQIVFLVDPKDLDTGGQNERWRKLKIEFAATSSGPWTTLYEPGTTRLIAIPVESGYLSAVPATPVAGMTVGAIRITYPDNTDYGQEFTVRYYGFMVGGKLAGGTNYGLARRASSGPAQSAGAILPAPTGVTVSGVEVPVSPLVGYVFRTSLTSPDGTLVTLYRNDYGAQGYYRIADVVAGADPEYADDGQAVADLTLPLPAGSAVGVPTGTSMASVNDRLMVCAGDRFWYSEAGFPFLFTQTVRFDSGQPVPTSGGSFSKAGETFTAIATVGALAAGSETQGTPQNGAVTVYPITDRNLYAVSGFDAASLNKTIGLGCPGTRSPFSIGHVSGGFFYLDSERQIRRVSGQSSSPVSKDQVDDLTKGIPNARLVWASGAVIEDRYYLAFTPEGGTANSNVLVGYDGWESLDRPYLPAQGLLTLYSQSLSRTRLLAFSQTSLYEHAAPGQATENGARVASAIVGPELESGTSNLNFAEATFVLDADAGGTATFSLDCLAGTRSGVASASVSLSPVTTGDRRVAKRSQTGKGALTIAATPRLDLSASGGTRLYHWSVETSPGNDAATA